MSHPARPNLILLQQGIDLLQELPPFLYGPCLTEYRLGSVGKHVRHILNFYECFLEGLSGGAIDYDARRRDVALESDVEAGIERMREVSDLLIGITWGRWDEPVRVKQNEGESSEDGGGEWSASTIGREMQSLLSHTVHHYAIIAVILRVVGVDCPKDFGVAPSTLKYQSSLEYASGR